MKLKGVNPISGQSQDLLDLSGYVRGIIGMAQLGVVVGGGIWLLNKVRGMAPSAARPLLTLPGQVAPPVGKVRRIYG